MVISQPLESTGTGRPTGLSWAVAFSILIHIAALWYFVSRFVIAPVAEQTPPPDIIMEPLPVPAPPPLPTIHEDPPPRDLLEPRDIKISHPTDLPPIPIEPVPEPTPAEPAGPPAIAQTGPAPAPKPTVRHNPVYPRRAQANEIEGVVTILLTIGAGGKVMQTEVVGEEPLGYGFGDSAARAVRKWEFASAAPGTYRVTVRFALE